MIVLIVIIVFGLWFAVQVGLHTPYPALAVATGSMCKLPGNDCDGWSHPFERTLHVGDLIIVQGVKPEEIHTGPEPGGDVIVFQPTWAGGDLIVHRAIGVKNESGHFSFITKGDGNSGADPDETSSDRVFGRVVMRIPWLGWLSLFMRNSSLAAFIIVLLIIVLVIVEIVVPSYTRRKSAIEEAASSESLSP